MADDQPMTMTPRGWELWRTTMEGDFLTGGIVGELRCLFILTIARP